MCLHDGLGMEAFQGGSVRRGPIGETFVTGFSPTFGFRSVIR